LKVTAHMHINTYLLNILPLHQLLFYSRYWSLASWQTHKNYATKFQGDIWTTSCSSNGQVISYKVTTNCKKNKMVKMDFILSLVSCWYCPCMLYEGVTGHDQLCYNLYTHTFNHHTCSLLAAWDWGYLGRCSCCRQVCSHYDRCSSSCRTCQCTPECNRHCCTCIRRF